MLLANEMHTRSSQFFVHRLHCMANLSKDDAQEEKEEEDSDDKWVFSVCHYVPHYAVNDIEWEWVDQGVVLVMIQSIIHSFCSGVLFCM